MSVSLSTTMRQDGGTLGITITIACQEREVGELPCEAAATPVTAVGSRCGTRGPVRYDKAAMDACFTNNRNLRSECWWQSKSVTSEQTAVNEAGAQ
jgi:hypothetical protein